MNTEPLRLGMNGSALLSPLTGIGQYTKNLTEALIALEELDLWLFYRYTWASEIRTKPMKHLSKLKAFIKKTVPHPYMVTRTLEQIRFTEGAHKHSLQLYHEPNFLTYNFAGPTVITAHDLSWIRYPETHPEERVAIMNKLFPRSLAEADHVITDAGFVRDEIIAQFGIAPDRITSIPLGARSVFHPRTEAECRPYLATHDLDYRSFILCVGTLEPRKNLEFMIRTYADLPEALRRKQPLVIVGMKGWLTTSLESVMQPLVAAGQVRPLGFATDDDLATLYASAAALVYPSLYEGFGLPPLEAMASGTPVIVSNRSTLPEVVGSAGILIDPTDDAALKEALLRLADDPVYWADRQAAALQQAAQFSWQRCARETLAIYRKVLAAR